MYGNGFDARSIPEEAETRSGGNVGNKFAGSHVIEGAAT
jgi:hypothetical protein